MITRQQVVDEARSWLGTPWHHGASLKSVGVDCIGYIAGVDINLGLPEGHQWLADLRYKGYGPNPIPKLLVQACDEYMDRIPQDKAGLGDVLQMNFVDRGIRFPMHFAFLSGPKMMLHAFAMFPRKVIEHPIDDTWSRRVMRAYRLRGVE